MIEISPVLAFGVRDASVGKGHEGNFWVDGNVLCLNRDMDYMGVCICQI